MINPFQSTKKEIEQLLNLLNNTDFRNEDKKSVMELSVAGEEELAIDTISTQLYEYDIKITPEIYYKIKKISKRLGNKETEFDYLKELIDMKLIKDIKPKDLVPGITGYYVHGNSLTLGYVEIKAGSILPEHHHVHEQITYIIEGQLDMLIGRKPCSLTAGTYYVIPSNITHSAVAKTDCKVIDVFNPVREDYKPNSNS